VNNLPNDLDAEYYHQRAGAGLIITGGAAPSPEALGHPRIPGIYSDKQVEAWKKVTARVHQKSSKIFLQLMHTGRIAHEDNLPDGLKPVPHSNIAADVEIFTDTAGPQKHTPPLSLTKKGIKKAIAGFSQASKNAMAAG